jgi:hypothetical protein
MEENIKKCGEEFENELVKILIKRIQARAKWGDSFLLETPQDLLVMIESKIRRYKMTKNYEAKVDSLQDAANYIIFLLARLNKKEEKDDKSVSL